MAPVRLLALIAALAAPALHAAAPATASTPVPAATVVSFSPQGTTKGVRQVVARFSSNMVALGDPRLADPFTIACNAPGRGRWVDTRSWAYDFTDDLPAGLSCTFQVRRGLNDLAGTPVSAPKPFRFDTGGPAILRSLPYEGSEAIDEEQAFLLKLDAPASTASIRAHAHCIVEGLAEAMPVVVIEGEQRAALLAQRRQLGYAYFRILWKDGEVTNERVRDASMKAAEQQVVAVRCQRRLPPAAQVELVWGPGIAAASGLKTTSEQRLAFRVRPHFTARVECTRTNPESGCLPFKPIEVRFTSPVPRAQALGLRLKADAQVFEPVALDKDPVPMLDAIRFTGPFPASSTVQVLLPAALQDDAGRSLSNANRFPVDVRVDEYPPLAKFSGEFGILEAREGGVLPVTLRNLDTPAAGTPAGIPARLVRVGPDPAAIAAWLRRVDAAAARRGDWKNDPKTGRGAWTELTGSTSVFNANDGASAFTVPKPAGEREFEVVGVPLKATGLYVVELESRRLGQSLLGSDRPRYVATAALVTNLAVHFKWGRESSIVWLTTLDTGKPVANAAVTVTGACDGKLRWSGTTDRDGLARIEQSLGDDMTGDSCDYQPQRPLIVMAQSGTDYSFALSWWTQGISPWDFGLPVGSKFDLNLFSTVLDRSLFRPGETVSMKHFLRRHASPGVVIDAGVPGERKVVIEHDGSEQKFETVATFDANGIAEQQWAIPPGARTGTYTVRIADARGELERSVSFRVEDFRLPTMRAEVTGPAKPQVQPKMLPIDLHVAYLAGGGAGGLPVTLRTYVDPQSITFRGYDEYLFGGTPVQEGTRPLGSSADEGDDEEGDGASTAESQQQPKVRVMPLTLDANGALRVEVADLPRTTASSTLTAELEYPDANGELLTQTSYIRLHPASLHVGLRREGWVGSAEQLRFRVVVLDLDGKPVPRQDVQVSLYQASDYSFRKRLIGGFYAYETTRETRRLPTVCAGRTDAAGLLSCEVAPGVSGQVLMRAETKDAAGRTAGATTSAWVVGADDWWFGGTSGDRMDVLPEQQEYNAGDKARLQVRMPFRRATALVTVEREGVLRAFVTPLSGKQPVVKLPIDAGDAPNVYVSVLAVRGRIARPEGSRKVAADTTVTALVDLNKPAFRLGNARLRVGWKPHRLDVAVTPDRKIYGVREKAEVQVVVKRADGTPLPAGSEVAIAAVDEALLQLSPNTSWALLDAMMGERGLEVWTATAQMQVVGKRHYGRKAVPHGGGGGQDHARRSFGTLLLWAGRVQLDANGAAKVVVPLNDSLSSFRIVAVASGGSQLFGTGSAGITTTQDLILLSGLPPLVREGDRFLATFTARNTSNAPQRVTLEATLTPGQPLDSREIELAPGEARDVAWSVVAPVGATRLGWEVRLRKADGASGDRLQVTQQVTAALPVRTYQATMTQLTAPWAVPVALPQGALPGRGGIDVSVQAKLAENLGGVRDFMARYPYTCLEQNLSRTIALGQRDQWHAWMQRLPSYQDDAGLLKYFPSNALPGEDVLTAYVLTLADVAGWPVPEAPRAQMIAGLTAFVRGNIQRDSALPTADLTVRKLAAIAALARHNQAEANMLDSLQLTPNLWPTSAVLDWLDILTRLEGVPNRATRLAEARNVLRSRVTFNGTTMTFSTERADALWWLMVSTDSNAARFLLTAVGDPQWREDVPRLVRGLLARQQRGHWNTTVANAWGTLALQRFSAKFESTPVTGKTGIALGTTRRELLWPTAEVSRSVALPWPAERTNLGVAHVGTGKPWVLVQASAALPLNAPITSGMAVTRSVVAVQQQTAGRWSRGDVVRVKLQVDAQADATWLVVDDPVPAGATILGSGLGGQSRRLTQSERSTGYAWPAFEERRFEAFRAYYRFVPKGRFTVEYTMRLNNPGTFQLPATRVEVMYAPETHAETPNAPLTIEAP
jgi:uncharacterized protein YfaS (alpha-2-macroglobulin family)